MRWASIYDQKRSEFDREIEEKIGSKLRKKKRLSKNDLRGIVKWKFEGRRLRGRRDRILTIIDERAAQSEISNRFTRALAAQDDKRKILELDKLPGVDPALASVILTFHDPKDYGVLDIHAWRELFGRQPEGLFQGPKHLLRFLERVRQIARVHELEARTVEKALFQRNYEEHPDHRHS